MPRSGKENVPTRERGNEVHGTELSMPRSGRENVPTRGAWERGSGAKSTVHGEAEARPETEVAFFRQLATFQPALNFLPGATACIT
jgi:hypothetical protein